MKTQYPHGVQVILPNIMTGEAQVVTLRGSFGVRKLRKMLRKILYINQRDQLDHLIKHCVVPLRPVTMDEMLEVYANETFEDDAS